MIKFFRKIRQNLLSENKFSKYIIYALGEIVLLVIGILVALQINTMNQQRQRAKLEKVLLDQVRFEILAIYEDIWRDTENLKLGMESHYRILDYINRDLPYNDSLCFEFHWLQIDEYIYPSYAAYTRLKEVGLDIIKDDTIRLAIQSLYEGFYPRLIKTNAYTPDISKVFDSYYLESFKPNSNFELEFYYQLPVDTVGSSIFSEVYYEYPYLDRGYDEKYTIGYVPLDFEALKKDPKFLMLLDQTKRYRDYKLRHYSNVKETAKLAIDHIERELNIHDN